MAYLPPSAPPHLSGSTSKSDRLFPRTSWSLLGRATTSAEETAAIRDFTDLYYEAIRGFVGSIVREPTEAEELTHAFLLTAVIQGQLLQRADRTRGAFRDYLKQAVRNFLTDDYRRRTRKKRRAPEPDLRPDALEGGWDAFVQKGSPAQDAAFLRAWAQGVVRVALDRTRSTCEQRDQSHHFQLFVGRYLASTETVPSWRELGETCALDENSDLARILCVAA